MAVRPSESEFALTDESDSAAAGAAAVTNGHAATAPADTVALNPYRPDQWPFLLSATEVSDMLRLNRNTVTVWCSTGRLDASKIGHEWRIPAEAVWPLIPETIRRRWPAGPWRRAQG